MPGTGAGRAPGARSRTVLAICWAALGVAMVVVSLWVGLSRLAVLLAGHPALLIAVIAGLLAGLLGVIWAVATLALGERQDRDGDPEHPAERTEQQLVRRSRLRIALAVPALVVCLLLTVLISYARPLPAAAVAVAALRPEGIRVVQRLSWYELIPATPDAGGRLPKPTTGLVFAPGARVDSRAYAHLLRPLVEAGYFVAVLKEPFGFALVDRGHAETVIGLHPEITYWAVGGHSLGGVAASGVADADRRVSGLVLWGSYPGAALQRGDLKVVSVSGSTDRFATPDRVALSRSQLPPTTRFVALDGVNHGYFGDYGEQPGDGPAVAGRQAAQERIVAETKALLASLTPPPPPKKKKK